MSESSQYETSRFKCEQYGKAHNLGTTEFKKRKSAHKEKKAGKKDKSRVNSTIVETLVILFLNALSLRWYMFILNLY